MWRGLRCLRALPRVAAAHQAVLPDPIPAHPFGCRAGWRARAVSLNGRVRARDPREAGIVDDVFRRFPPCIFGSLFSVRERSELALLVDGAAHPVGEDHEALLLVAQVLAAAQACDVIGEPEVGTCCGTWSRNGVAGPTVRLVAGVLGGWCRARARGWR